MVQQDSRGEVALFDHTERCSPIVDALLRDIVRAQNDRRLARLAVRDSSLSGLGA